MDSTVFFTVLSGVLTYVAGQLVVKLLIEPVQDLRRTIGFVSHSLIERAHIIHNPGVSEKERMDEVSRELRKLAAQLQSHLYLIPIYRTTARVFRLPSRERVMNASKALIGLSNTIFEAKEINRDAIEKYNQMIRDALGILRANEDATSE